MRFDGIRFSALAFSNATNPPVSVTDLCEDHAGSLWIGTKMNGVFCIQSNRVSHYTKADGLADNFVTSLAVDAEGKMWVGTHLGLNIWSGARFLRLSHKDGLPDENISSIYVSRQGTVWVTTHTGICTWRDGRLQSYAFDADSQGRNPEFLGVYEDRKKNLWAFGDTYLINLADPLGNRLNNFRRGDLSSSRLWSFCEGHDGRLWVGTSGQGLLQFTGDSYRPFRPAAIRNGKLPNDVRSVCEDREGNLWLGTEASGLVQLRQERMRLLGATEGLPNAPALCLVEDAAHRICPVFVGDGLFISDGEHFEPAEEVGGGEYRQFIRSISSTTNGEIWLASDGSGITCLQGKRFAHFTSANGLKDNFVTAICAATNQPILAGARSGEIYALENNRWRTVANAKGGVTALLTAGSDRWYVATESGEVSLLVSNRMIQLISTNLTAGKAVSSLCLDSVDRLWFATDGNGIGYTSGNFIKNWTTEEGLPDNRIFSLVFDGEQNLWLTTGKGIFRAENSGLSDALKTGRFPATRLIRQFANGETTSSGWPASVHSHDDLLWFATGRGIVRFDPRDWSPDNQPPPVYLETVSVNGETIFGADRSLSSADLSPAHPVKIIGPVRSLDFEFTSPCLAVPEKARFRYQLEGFDEDWIEGDSENRRVHYGAIPNGKYRFHVIACNADGTWNKTGASLWLVVPPPWWRTVWALVFYVLAMIFLVSGVVRYVSHRRLQKRLLALEQSQAMSRERMRIAQDMHDEIGSKLARISFLSEGLKNEASETDMHAEKADSIANTSRDLLQSLDQMVWAVNPRNDSLENLVAYLGQYAIEYFQNTSVVCDVRLPQSLPAIPLSAEVRHNLLLAFEEGLSNALKHACARRVNIEMKLENQIFEISIADDGAGFDPQKPASESDLKSGRERHGLSGMKFRLQMVGGECELKSAAGAGTVIKFSIPLKRFLQNKS